MIHMRGEFLNDVQGAIVREYFRGAVGRAIWCNRCERVLDCRAAVECTIWNRETDEPASVQIVCAACADEMVPTLEQSIEAHNARNDPRQFGFPWFTRRHCFRLETIDGRTIYAQPKPKRVATRGKSAQASYRARLRAFTRGKK